MFYSPSCLYIAFPYYVCYQTVHTQSGRDVLCVNLTGLRDAQIAGKTLFLGMSVMVSMEEISI